MEKDTGGTAFPWVESYVNVDKGERYENYGDAGMTLRDYFAAKAMQGILANPGQLDSLNADAIKWVTNDSYRMADAMLAARGQ